MKPTSNCREVKTKMDKPKNENTITIKINGVESPVHEDNKKDIIDQQSDDTNEQTATTANPHELESAAAQEKNDDNDNFDWVLPNTTPTQIIEEFQQVPDPIKKKKKVKDITDITTVGSEFKFNKQTFRNMKLSTFLAIFFAVILGTFFGLMLLKIVPAEKVVENEQPVINQEVQKESGKETSQPSGTLEGKRQALSLAVVQEGIYSSKEGAENIKKNLNDQGIPAEVFAANGQFAIFVGISNNVEEAKVIGNTLKTSGIDTYAKQWSIEEKNLSKLNEEEKKVLEMSSQVYASFNESISSVNGSNPISPKLMEDVTKHTSSLTAIDKGKLQNQSIIGIHSQLEAASSQLKEYNNKPQSSTLNGVQQHLLSFLSNYQSL
jgi:stage II sporulation protein B